MSGDGTHFINGDAAIRVCKVISTNRSYVCITSIGEDWRTQIAAAYSFSKKDSAVEKINCLMKEKIKLIPYMTIFPEKDPLIAALMEVGCRVLGKGCLEIVKKATAVSIPNNEVDLLMVESIIRNYINELNS